MASATHQHLLNSLANKLEKRSVRVTHLDMGDTPEMFDAKYRRLPSPPPIDGKIADLWGKDDQGVIHLGEAETSASGSHTEDQLRAFGRCVMPKTNAPVPLHVIVPFEYAESMKNMLRRIGLGGEIGSKIHVWRA